MKHQAKAKVAPGVVIIIIKYFNISKPMPSLSESCNFKYISRHECAVLIIINQTVLAIIRLAIKPSERRRRICLCLDRHVK
jgi:hypothetical protein